MQIVLTQKNGTRKKKRKMNSELFPNATLCSVGVYRIVIIRFFMQINSLRLC